MMRKNVKNIVIHGPTTRAIIKNRIIRLSHEFSEMHLKRSIPCLLVTKTPFYILQTDIKISPMKQVVRSLDYTRLEQGKISNRLLVRIGHPPNIRKNNIKPVVLFIREIDILKRRFNKIGIRDIRMTPQQFLDFPLFQFHVPVFDQCFTNQIVKRKKIIIRDLLALLFHSISDTTGTPESIQNRVERNILYTFPYPIHVFLFTPLIAG